MTFAGWINDLETSEKLPGDEMREPNSVVKNKVKNKVKKQKWKRVWNR